MIFKENKGFSLIELILVLVIIGVLATITFPFLYRAKGVAENGNAFATMRTISSTQLSFFTSKGRFARLSELNTIHSDALGTISGNDLIRGKFTFEMVPAAPSDAQLRDSYSIIATKSVVGSELPFVISISQSGQIVQVLP
ncbi:hypothetical protein BH10ACI1_BH10ACI1_09940 [soil metagenome]